MVPTGLAYRLRMDAAISQRQSLAGIAVAWC